MINFTLALHSNCLNFDLKFHNNSRSIKICNSTKSEIRFLFLYVLKELYNYKSQPFRYCADLKIALCSCVDFYFQREQEQLIVKTNSEEVCLDIDDIKGVIIAIIHAEDHAFTFARSNKVR